MSIAPNVKRVVGMNGPISVTLAFYVRPTTLNLFSYDFISLEHV